IAADAFTAAKFANDVTTEFQNGLATAAAVNTVMNDVLTVQDTATAILADTETTIPGTLAGLATQASIDTIDGIIDNIYTAFENDSGVYRLTTNALEQGGAVSLDPEDIEAIGLAAAEGIDNEAIATAVWADTTATGLLTSVADIPTN